MSTEKEFSFGGVAVRGDQVCVIRPRGKRVWALPKGGASLGEDGAATAAREVREETGLTVERADVGPLVWTQESTFLHRAQRRFARCHGRVVRVADPDAVGAPALMDDEQDTVLGQRWWTPADLAASTDRFFPRGVPGLLPRLLAGERVDEPFDTWD